MDSILLLATEAAGGGGGATFIKGFAAFLGFVIFFVGSVWLLTSMILGPKLGYLVTGACLFSVFAMLSAIWFVTGLGPKGEQGFLGSLGEDTAWHAIATGPELGEEDSRYGTLDFGGYPDGEGWVEPSRRDRLADLKEGQSTSSELQSAEPVLEALVADAVSEIPGIREDVEDQVRGEVTLDPENFTLTDFRVKETEVAGKESLVAVGKAVPIAELTANLGAAPAAAAPAAAGAAPAGGPSPAPSPGPTPTAGASPAPSPGPTPAAGASPAAAPAPASEGELVRYVVEEDAQVRPGDPVAEVRAGDQTIVVTADKEGRIVDLPFDEGEQIKAGVAIADVDISGQPGAPQPVEVAAARVRGSVKVPSFIYLVASLVLMVAHLVALRRYEEEHRIAEPQTA